MERKEAADEFTTDELKVQLAEYNHAVKDLEEAPLAIEASRSACRSWSIPRPALAFMMMPS